MRAPWALALLLSLVPRLAPAQAPVEPVSAYDADLDREIRFWEDMRHKIEDLHHLYIPGPSEGNVGVLISREQEANMFSYLILTGKMSPDSTAILAEHRKVSVSTQVLLQTVKQSLKELNDELLRRQLSQTAPPVVTGPPPTAPPAPAQSFHAEGQWRVRCSPPTPDEGTQLGVSFFLDVRSDGLVQGAFAYGRITGHLNVTGTLAADGTVQGDRRDEAAVTVTWGGQLTRSGSGTGTIRLELHNPKYTGTCDGRWWTSDRPRPADL